MKVLFVPRLMRLSPFTMSMSRTTRAVRMLERPRMQRKRNPRRRLNCPISSILLIPITILLHHAPLSRIVNLLRQRAAGKVLRSLLLVAQFRFRLLCLYSAARLASLQIFFLLVDSSAGWTHQTCTHRLMLRCAPWLPHGSLKSAATVGWHNTSFDVF